MARVEQYLEQQITSRGDAAALSDSVGTRWTFNDLGKASDAVADQLRAAGVQPNDRVLLLSENCGAAVATIFGTWKAGAVIIPVNARQTEGEVKRILDHCKATNVQSPPIWNQRVRSPCASGPHNNSNE